MGSYNADDSIKIAKALNDNGKTISPTMARSLAANIPASQPVNEIASIASQVPFNCLNIAKPSDLVTSIAKMDLDNMDDFRKGFIVQKISTSNDASTLINLMKATSDPAIIGSIPSSLISKLGIDISSIPAANLPQAYVINIKLNIFIIYILKLYFFKLKEYAKTSLKTKSLSDITDLDILSKILPGVILDDLNNVSNSKKADTIVILLNLINKL